MASLTDPLLEALWKKALDDWDSDEAHGAFLQHCQNTDQLAEAAARYRGMAGDRDRGPSAEKRLKSVAMLALARLESQRSAPPRRSTITNLVLIAAFLAGSFALLWLLMD